MSEKYKPVKGDRVRVVLEGEVTEVWADLSSGDRGLTIDDILLSNSEVRSETVVSVEKIEPDPVLPAGLTISEDGNLLNWQGENYTRQPVDEPVEVFKPGDVVQAYGEAPGDAYVIAKDGYLELPSGNFYADGPDTHKMFTSKFYKKVSLG